MRKQGISLAGGLAVMGAGLLLAGCSNWSYQPAMRGNPVMASHNVAEAETKAPKTPSDFPQALASDYASYATSLQGELKDYADADYFARKSEAAGRGKVVPPEDNANWLVPLEVPDKFRTELAQSRARLVCSSDLGGRERLPAVAARAQVSYDCWVERMEDDWKTAINGPCRQQFMAALAQLEGQPVTQPPAPPAAAPAPTREYRVYFEFDKSNLLPEAQQIIQQVANQVKAAPATRVKLIGKADRAGTDKYNLALSHRRASAVRAALQSDGVPAGSIEEQWVGEREPPVPTPDGVREPRNRVVEITLQ